MAGGDIFTSNWSNQYTRQFFMGSLFAVCIVIFSVFLMQSSLSRIDRDGCFKRHCDLSSFDPKYANDVIKMHKKNKCLRNIKYTQKKVDNSEPINA